MEITLQTEKGVPPGLLLPLPEEPTDKFLAKHFAYSSPAFEDIVDYGSFMVALLVWDAENSDRVSMMPTGNDVQALREEGYGMDIRTLHTYGGGIRCLQNALGFYSGGYKPDKETLIQRFEWLGDYALPQAGVQPTSLDEVMQWGSQRNLLPSRDDVYQIMGGDLAALHALRKRLGVEVRNRIAGRPQSELYKFGAEVITDNNGPITGIELDQLYQDRFTGSPYETIRYQFGSYNNFWREFDFIPHSRGMTKSDILNIGIQWMIQHDGETLTTGQIEEYSAAQRFPSRQPIRRLFGGVPNFWEAVTKGYTTYQKMLGQFEAKGVTEAVFKVVCRRFEPTKEFTFWLTSNQDVLVALSAQTQKSEWALRILKNGFSLKNQSLFDLQLEDFVNFLTSRGISGKSMQFVFDIIPRINADEVMGMVEDLRQ